MESQPQIKPSSTPLPVILLKILGWAAGIPVTVFFTALLVLQIPRVQQWGVNRAARFLESRTGSPVSIRRISLAFPDYIVLEKLFIAGKQGDTLLYGGEVKANLSMTALAGGRVIIHEVLLRDVNAALHRDTAGNYNFSHIIDAFSGSEPSSPGTSSEPVALELDRIKIDRARFRYLDEEAGIDGHFSITQLRSSWQKPDLANLQFRLNNLVWNGGGVNLKMWKVAGSTPAPPDTTPNLLPLFAIENGSISEVAFQYVFKEEGLDMDAHIGSFNAEGLRLDLTGQVIHLGKSKLSASDFSFRAGPSAPAPPSATDAPNWIITGNEVSLSRCAFVYDDLLSPRINKGMDYGHLGFSNINLSGKNLYVSNGDTVKADIESGSLNEKSGLKVNSFSSNLFYTTRGIRLNNLSLVTPTSRLSKSVAIAYPSPSYVAEHPGELWMDANLSKAKLSHLDLLTAVPLLYDYPMFADLPNAVMEVDGKISGKLNNLTLTNVTAKGFGNTRIKGSGTLKGLPDPYQVAANLNIQELATTDKDIRKIIPPGTIPGYVVLPETMRFRGKVAGKPTENMTVDLGMYSSMGDAVVKGYIKNAADAKLAEYNLSGRLFDFEAGKLTGNPLIGKQTLSFSARGKGYDPAVVTGHFETDITSSAFDGIAYRNIRMQADASRGEVTMHGFSHEEIHDFEINLRANMQGEFPSVSSTLNLRSVDLFRLGYSSKPFTVGTYAEIDFPRLDPDHPKGWFRAGNIHGVYDTSAFHFDSLSAIAAFSDDRQSLFLNTDFGTVNAEGNYSVTALVPELINFINQYYTLAPPSPALRGDQQAKIDITVKPSPQVLKLLPGLEMQKSAEFSLDFNSKECLFDLTGYLPYLAYAGQSVTGGSFFAESNDSALAYKIYIDDYEGGGYQVPTILLQGDVLDHKLYPEIRLLDDYGRLQHTLSARIMQKNNGYSLHIDPGSVLLNYEKWGLDPGNEIYFDDNGVFANDFTFSNGSQAIVMQSYGDSVSAPIGLRLFNFKLSTFTSIARQDSLYLDGMVNGYAELMLSTEHPAFFADVTVSDLMYKKDSLGTVVVNVKNDEPDVYNLKAGLSGFGNILTMAGDFNGATKTYDIQFDIEKLMLKTLQPFAMGYLTQMTGHIEGGLSLSGNQDSRSVFGNMLFRDAEANVPLLNSVFSLRNERIRFTREGIVFDAFTLTDQNARKAVLHGKIETSNWINYVFNLDFEANDFRVVNSTRRDNKLFYGTLYLDSRIKFRGTPLRPDIDATFRANEKTDLTMVMPQEDPDIAERDGVVEFFDADIPENDSGYIALVDSLNTSALKGLNINANFEVDERAKLSFVIDDANGDMVVAKGKAVLTGAIDPSGKVSVTGTYELKEGTYDMSLKGLMKFKFQIESGSTITWTGEPTDADINITALYNVKTAPYDLVEQLINSESEESKAKYKDRIPFRVKLKMRGELLKPDITFDIEVAETSGSSAEVISTINTKLEQLRVQPSEMNKQVFALILIGSFVPDNPFGGSSNSESVNAFARQSVSKLLSDQLNTLAGSLISGIDIDIGIDSDQDYSTGTGQARTDLNVAFSKRLLKDRLKITVGSNFELEGAARPNEKTSNIAGDIKADYILSRSGQYVLRAYRLDQYEVALQGQVVETGLTFIITLDFDHFREIFERKKKDQKRSN